MFALIVDRQATELGRLIGQALVSAIEPRSDKFSPRLARVDLSPATVHQYVTALYRHFGVRSRAQLLSLALKRIGRNGSSKPVP